MKLKLTLLLSLCLSNGFFAQHGYLDLFPIKGKVKSLETINIIGEGEKEQKVPIEQFTYDNTNRLISKKKYEQRGTANQEKNVYQKDLIITYECRCANIDDFIAVFAIRDKAELKNVRGMGTGNGPTKFVTYDYLDKKGNSMTRKRYSEKRYQTSETRTTYTTANKIANRKTYDFDDKLKWEEAFEYDKKGNQVKTINNDLEYSQKTINIYKYDDNNYQYEFLNYENERLSSHYNYSKIRNGDKEEFYETNNLKNTKILRKENFYGPKDIILQTNEYNNSRDTGQKTIKKFTEDGVPISIEYVNFNGEGSLLTKRFEYVFDSNHNWIEMTLYEFNSTQKDRPETKKKYIRKIEYSK